MEVTLEGAYSLVRHFLTLRFNPYSIGSYSGRGLYIFQSKKRLFVSILILLEVTLEVFLHHYFLRLRSRFNPYSIGSYSGRLLINTIPSCKIHVSILILLEVTLEVVRITAFVVRFDMFQSLFYWKLLWKRKFQERFMKQYASFNPYSIGSYSGRLAISIPYRLVQIVSILILLEVTLEECGGTFY